MNAIQAVVNGALATIMYMALFGTLYKLFAISKELAEIKAMLKERPGQPPVDPYLAHAERMAAVAASHNWSVLEPEK